MLSGFYKYLEGIMPLRPILISAAVGIIALGIVLVSGLTSEYVRGETVATRALTAFSFTGLMSFIIMMCGEEYALFRTKRELETFIDDAELQAVNS